MMLLATLIALALCAAPTLGQQKEAGAKPEWEPSKYRITKAHLLDIPQGPQAGVSRGRFIINFGSREGIKPGGIFNVMHRGEHMALIRIHRVWRDSAEAGLVHLIQKIAPESPVALKPGYYLEPKLVLLETIQFDKGDPVITTEMYERLHYIARFIRAFPQFPLLLEGHTDSQGNAAKNAKLAEERAEGVRLFLNEVYRLPMQQMLAVGFGEERPVATNEHEAGRYRNRRVDIVLMDSRPH